jgi:hypothetical protein
VLVQQAVLGVYFGMLFAPNHKGLPVRTDAESLDWLERRCSPRATSGRASWSTGYTAG